MEKKNPIEEARRYVANAKEVIKKAELDEKLHSYNDPKYVKMAGNTLWNGCLIALDAALGMRKNLKKDQRLSIDDYKAAAAKRDKKLLSDIVKAYTKIHLSMGYDGDQDPDTSKSGFSLAKDIIDRCAILIK